MRLQLGTGATAIHNTLKLMAKMIRQASENYYVRRWAETETTVQDNVAALQALYDFVASNTRYVKDIDGLEMLRNPLLTLKMIEGGEQPGCDCDCLTMLYLSLVRSVGYPVALRALSIDGVNYSHVYGLVRLEIIWIPADLTHPRKELGLEYEYARKKMDYIV